MKNKLSLLIISLLITTLLSAQNRESFFKTVPAIDNATPEWAVEMYSSNPNVLKVDFDYSHYYQIHTFEKNIHTQNYKHWRRFVDEYVDGDGHIIVPGKNWRMLFTTALQRSTKLIQ